MYLNFFYLRFIKFNVPSLYSKFSVKVDFETICIYCDSKNFI